LLNIVKKSTLIFIFHLDQNGAALFKGRSGFVFGVKVILANLSSYQLAVFGHFYAFRI
jgi:hypothetical protein